MSRAVFFLMMAGFVLMAIGLPIHMSDTDYWYHLAGGRHLFENGELHNPYRYSFIPDKQPFINYFWGFQAIVYSGWLIFADYSPVILRTLVLTGTAWLAARILLQNKPFESASPLAMAMVILVLFALSFRYTPVRPHLFSYLFITAFLYILLHQPRRFFLLPILTIAWVNIHGVEWVVGAMICGLFFLSRCWQVYLAEGPGVFKAPLGHPELRSLLWLVACAPAVLVNPWGIYVLPTPFMTGPEFSLITKELRPRDLSLDLSSGLNLNATQYLIMGALLCVTALRWRHWRKDPFPVLLALCSLGLFIRGLRFIWEWILLSLPLLSCLSHYYLRTWPEMAARAVPVVTLLLVINTWSQATSFGRHRPINYATYPEGTTRFVEQFAPDTRYAAPPTVGGYLQWRLSPRTQIFADMETPPYTAVKLYEFFSLREPSSFNRFVATYEPHFIAVRLTNASFQDAARDSAYKPVFFDNVLVLYANQELLPEVVEEHELKTLNPYNVERISRADVDKVIDELQRVLSIDPTVEKASTILMATLIDSGELDPVPGLLAAHRDDAERYYYDGKLKLALGEPGEAAVAFARSYEIAESRETGLLAAQGYFVTNQPIAAYDMYAEVLNPYLDPEPDWNHFFQYGLVSLIAGDERNARNLLALMKVLDDNTNAELKAAIESLADAVAQAE